MRIICLPDFLPQWLAADDGDRDSDHLYMMGDHRNDDLCSTHVHVHVEDLCNMRDKRFLSK